MRRPPLVLAALLVALLAAFVASGGLERVREAEAVGDATPNPERGADLTPGDLGPVEDGDTPSTIDPSESAADLAMPPVRPVEVDLGVGSLGAGRHDLEATATGPDGDLGPMEVRVHVPDGPGPFPVIVGLHPFGSTGPAFDGSTGLGEAGVAAGAVVVLPSGPGRSWNASLTCCGPALDQDRPDVGFVLGLVDAVARVVPLEGRALLTGFSNGGFLSYRIACRAADRVAAVVVVAGTMDEVCRPSGPVSVWHLHGTQDLVVPFEDDRAPHSPQATGRGARDVATAWATLNGCGAAAADGPTEATWAGCPGGVIVTLDVLDGWGHRWPDGRGTVEVVRFLLDHR